MPKSSVGVKEGSDKNIATYSFTEDSLVKHMERTVLSAPDITINSSNSTDFINLPSIYPVKDVTPSSATISGTFNNFNAGNSVDGNLSTKGWDTNGDSVNTNLIISLSTAAGYTGMSLYVSSANYDGKYDILYSDDEANWNTAYSNWSPTTSGWNYVYWPHKGKHKYWKLNLSTASSSVNGDFMELKTYSPDLFECSNSGIIVIKSLFSASNGSCTVRALFYDSNKVIIGSSDEVSLVATPVLEDSYYVGTLFSLSNNEVGASYFNLVVTTVPNGMVKFVIGVG